MMVYLVAFYQIKIPKLFRMKFNTEQSAKNVLVNIHSSHQSFLEQKELLQKFGESMGKAAKKHSPNEKSWIDGMKKFFEDMKS